MGYLKRDGRPEAGRRSKILQLRIGTVEYDAIKQASIREGVSVSEYMRAAAHARRTFERLQQDLGGRVVSSPCGHKRSRRQSRRREPKAPPTPLLPTNGGEF